MGVKKKKEGSEHKTTVNGKGKELTQTTTTKKKRALVLNKKKTKRKEEIKKSETHTQIPKEYNKSMRK